MKKVAVYPGTFDPITFGHIDVIKKALKLFDKVIVAASDGTNKDYLFNYSSVLPLKFHIAYWKFFNNILYTTAILRSKLIVCVSLLTQI